MSSKIPLARAMIKQVADALTDPTKAPLSLLELAGLADQLMRAEAYMHRAKPDFVAPRVRPTPTPQEKALAKQMRALGHSYDDIEIATGMQRGRISDVINPPS
jgi:hypothetical protein